MPDNRRVEEAVALLRQAKRPIIIAGGGVHYSEAWEELLQFAEQNGIPVGETFAGRGALRKDSPMVIGGHGVTEHTGRCQASGSGRSGHQHRYSTDRFLHRIAVHVSESRS